VGSKECAEDVNATGCELETRQAKLELENVKMWACNQVNQNMTDEKISYGEAVM